MIPAPGEIKGILRSLRSDLDKINRLVGDLLEEETWFRPQAGEWSIKEVLCHMRDREEVFAQRVEVMAQGEDPLPFFHDWRQDSMELARSVLVDRSADIIAAFRRMRRWNIGFLEQAPGEFWSKEAHHESYGAFTIFQEATDVARHDQEHLAQLRSLKALSSA